MEGTHPFAGKYRGPGDPPPIEARIGAGHFPHSAGKTVPFSPDGTALASGGIDHTVRLWKVRKPGSAEGEDR